MALQGIGNSISFKDIQTEFGRPTDGKFGNYRISQNIGDLTNLPLDKDIPTSGEIKFSHFYSKKLNIVVDFYNDDEDLTRQDIKARFNGGRIEVIGPRSNNVIESTSGKKIIAHVNKLIGSENSFKSEIRRCSLLTGEWDPNTELIINVGSAGTIIGAGGDGGRGSEGAGDFFAGKDGTSAIGINTTQDVTIINNGLISCGFGGGGGGKGGSKRVKTGKKKSVTAVSSGGGGGGGAGFPFGLGGTKGTGATQRGSDGQPGDDGEIDEGGAGGNGGNTDDATTLTGGQGGDSAASATAGDNSGGAAGNNGFLIVTINGSIPDNISGSGTNLGTNSLNTTPI